MKTLKYTFKKLFNKLFRTQKTMINKNDLQNLANLSNNVMEQLTEFVDIDPDNVASETCQKLHIRLHKTVLLLTELERQLQGIQAIK